MRKVLIACCMMLAAAAAAKTTLVTSLKVQEAGPGMCRVTIKSNEPLVRHKVISFESPPKMVIDVTGAVNRLKRQIKLKNDIVKRVRTSQFSMRPQKVRIVLDLHEKVSYSVEDGKSLTFLLKSAAAVEAAKQDSVNAVAMAAASVESLRTADSLQQAAVAESLAQASGGIGAMLGALTEGGLVIPIAGGGGVLLLAIIIMLVVRSVRKRKKAEAEFEDMLAAENPDDGNAPRPNNWFDEKEGGEAAAEQSEEDVKLDMLENELAKVKEQADKLTEIGGFEVSVVDNEPADTPEVNEAPAETADDSEGTDSLPELDDAPVDTEKPAVTEDDDMLDFADFAETPDEPAIETPVEPEPSTEAPAAETPVEPEPSTEAPAAEALVEPEPSTEAPAAEAPAAPADDTGAEPEAAGDDFNIDEFQKAFSGADSGTAAVGEVPAVGDDDFDLDATIAQLKDKMKSPPAAAPVAEPEVELPQTIDDVLDTDTMEPETVEAPAGEPVLDDIPGPSVPVEPVTEPSLPVEPAAVAVEPVSAPAVDPAEAARLKESMEKYDAQESRIVEQLDTFHTKMEGYKNLLAEREARLAKMVELNDKISRDMDDVQARLDTSLQQLDKMQSAAPPAVPETPDAGITDIAAAADEPVSFDVDMSVGDAGTPVIDVIVDDPVDFAVDAVTTESVAPPAVEPVTATDVPDEAPVDVDDVFGSIDTETTETTDAAGTAGIDDGLDLPDFGAVETPSPETVAPAAPAPAPAAAPDEDEPKFKKVFRLTDEGLDVTSVAQQLGIGRGQVELFLKLREKGKMS